MSIATSRGAVRARVHWSAVAAAWRLLGVAVLGLAALGWPAGALAGPATVVPAGFVDEFLALVTRPTGLAYTPDGRVLVASQGGQLRVYQNGQLLPTPSLDLASVICDNWERGLAGVAVDPAFATNHYIYLYYTYKKFGVCPLYSPQLTTNPVNRVSRFTLLADNTILTTTEVVLLDNITQSYGIHNGGDMAFGADGRLYITTGDGAGPNGQYENPRRLSYLGAKILRINSDGTIPPDNPYAALGNSRRCGDPAGVPPGSGPCKEVYSAGLRNPFRFAFKPGTNEFYVNDVGQATWEEVNQGAPGADFGWNEREGPCPFSNTNCQPAANPAPPNLTNPVHYYHHGIGCNSITGAAFVPPGIWPVAYDNAYLFGDFGCGRIWRLVGTGPASSRVEFVTGLGSASLVSMKFVPHGDTQALYYMLYGGWTSTNGQLRRIVYTGQTNQPPVAALSATPAYGAAPLEVVLSAAGSSDPNGESLLFDWDLGDGTLLTGTTTLSVTHLYASPGVYTPTVRAHDGRGGVGAASARIDSGNTPPVPVITRLSPDGPVAVGDVMEWQASGTDLEDDLASLPLTYTWDALLHHVDAAFPGNAHFHPYGQPAPGETYSFGMPPPEDLGATALSYVELRLTATDSWGLAEVASALVEPKRVTLLFDTVPPGFELTLDSLAVTAPYAATAWENWVFVAEAPLQTDAAGAPWGWTAWEAGDPLTATRTITTPDETTAYTATLETTTTLPLPQVFQVQPATGPLGVAAPFTVTVTGKNFGSEAVVVWDGQPLAPTVFISSTELQALAPGELLAQGGPVLVTAANPEPGGGAAPGLEFLRRWRIWLTLVYR